MIAKIRRAVVRRYTDSGQVVAIVEWKSREGKVERTEGRAIRNPNRNYSATRSFGYHMHMLFAEARKAGIRLERETW